MEIACGNQHSLARRSDGQLAAWGANLHGQLNVPPLPPGLSYTDCSGGALHSMACRSDGQLLAWGFNFYGQCNVPSPPAGVTYSEFDGGGYHSVALRSDGLVVAWGYNNFGQCNAPPPPAGVSYLEIAAGYMHTLARRSDGQVIAWGANDYGQCSVPVLPPGVTYSEIAAGEYNSIARRSDGQVLAWGYNPGKQQAPALPSGTAHLEISGGDGFFIARYGAECTAPTVYCTAKTNSLGCSPSISMNGMPSMSSGACTVSAANLLGQKVGLYLHSATSSASLPFHGGFLCVQAPLKRHQASSTSGTAGQCDGTLSEDFQAYLASGADPALTAGSKVWLQAWYRDPGDPFGDGLSDAVNAVICP